MALADNVGLIAHMNGNWLDSSGNNNHGTPNGATLVAPGFLGSGEGQWDGIDDRVDFGSDASLRPTAAFTWGGWIRVNTWGGQTENYMLFDNFALNGADRYGYLCFIGVLAGQLGRIGLQTGDGGPTGYFTVTANGLISLLTRHCVVFRFDGTSIKLFIDGVLRAHDTVGIPAAIDYTFANSTSFGWSQEFNLGFYEGKIDEGILWQRAITDGGVTVIGSVAPGEIAEFYNGGVGVEVNPVSAAIPPHMFQRVR